MANYSHLVIDAIDIQTDTFYLDKKAFLKMFIDDIVKALKMQKLGRLKMEYLDEPEELKGYSVVQLIHTSSIVLHIFNNTKKMNLDVFSCKEFDPAVVLELVKLYFKPAKVRTDLLERI